MKYTYIVQRSRSRKLWIPRDGWRWPPPRLVQLLRRLRCVLTGHAWSPWHIDDYEGPMQDIDEDTRIPLCFRESRPNEFGMRSCECGAIETRYPFNDAPPKLRGEYKKMRN